MIIKIEKKLKIDVWYVSLELTLKWISNTNFLGKKKRTYYHYSRNFRRDFIENIIDRWKRKTRWNHLKRELKSEITVRQWIRNRIVLYDELWTGFDGRSDSYMSLKYVSIDRRRGRDTTPPNVHPLFIRIWNIKNLVWTGRWSACLVSWRHSCVW